MPRLRRYDHAVVRDEESSVDRSHCFLLGSESGQPGLPRLAGLLLVGVRKDVMAAYEAAEVALDDPLEAVRAPDARGLGNDALDRPVETGRPPHRSPARGRPAR